MSASNVASTADPALGALLALCGTLCGITTHLPRLDATAAARLYAEADHQNITALVAQVLPADAVPPATRLQFLARQQLTADQFNHKRQTLGQLLDLFNGHHLNTMVLKGIGLARCYPQPHLRPSGDIDIYLGPRWREADALAAEHLGVTIQTDIHHHSKYNLNGVLVENHFDILNRQAHRDSAALDDLLKAEAATGARPYRLDGRLMLLPSPTFNALFTLAHNASHFAADRITLRHLLDWTFLCRAEGDDVDWERVYRTAARFGFLPFALAMEELCRRHLGHTPRLHPSASDGLHPIPDSTHPTPDNRHPAADNNHAEPSTPNASDDTPTDNTGALADRILDEILCGHFHDTDVPSTRPVARIAFKWRRLRASRWKHDICYATPFWRDLPYALHAKLTKPHTILH